MGEDYDFIQRENAELRSEIERLRLQLQLLVPNPAHDNKLGYRIEIPTPLPPAPTSHTVAGSPSPFSSPSIRSSGPQPVSNPHAPFLSNPEIRRYGRQLILPCLGIEGQKKLKSTRILIIGAGGLGSPAGLYLASAGVGQIGIVDHDSVDASNLHRQIIHNESREGRPKALSAKIAIESINSFCDCQAYTCLLDSSNALEIINNYDIVLDASDNVATRYLINDACVLAGKPLVSGSALRLHGQLVIYNYKGGPCYRCLHPNPPPPETVTNCADGGVLGPVTGVIGSLQAMEAIKIALDMHKDFQPTLLMYSADRTPAFLSLKIRSRKPICQICGDSPTIHELQDYVQFCGQPANDDIVSQKLLTSDQRISCPGYRDWINLHSKILPYLLLDVRDPVQYAICRLPNSINIPLRELKDRLPELEEALEQTSYSKSPSGSSPHSKHTPTPVRPVLFVICRLGNDSQTAVNLLNQHFEGNMAFPAPRICPEAILDIIGGLYSWTKQVDDQFPIY